jgi:4-methylaminobutanoate oxidase (formaldehyde-forming)
LDPPADPGTARAVLTDVTSAYAVIGVMGPRSRTLLQRVSDASLDAAAFRFGAIREIGIGHATVLAARRSYMGELGWELYVPTEFAATVYDTLGMAGADLGLRDAGTYAIDALRIEKGYRAWGRELTPDDTPWQAGMGFAVRLDKGVDFIGRAALVEAKAAVPARRLVSFLATEAETPMAWGGELILADGAPVGEVTSVAYGHAVGGLVGLGWVKSIGRPVDEAWLAQARFAIDIAGETVAVRCSLKPFYDPESKRLRS